jgi:cation diffusion facilitator CzcD-associated flavoprotein CzcO
LHWRKHSVDFVGKRIAIIGNGSSAIQLLPGLAAIDGVTITQYVRSGGYYFPKVNTAFSSTQRFIYDWVPGARLWYRYSLFKTHNDRWRARGTEGAEGHEETEQMLLKYLEKETPAEYLEALRPAYRTSCSDPG